MSTTPLLTITISNIPVQIPSTQEDFTIVNNSVYNVSISTDPTVQTNVFILPTGSALSFPPGPTYYATIPSGTATITVLSGNRTYTGGSVNVNGSTVNIGNTPTVNPNAVYDILYNQSAAFGLSGSLQFSVANPGYSYQNILVYFAPTSGSLYDFTCYIANSSFANFTTPTVHLPSLGLNFGSWTVFPVPFDPTDNISFTISGGANGQTGNVIIAALRSPLANLVLPTPGQPLNVVPLGGQSHASVIATTVATAYQIVAAPAIGYAYRLHNVSTYQGASTLGYNAIILDGTVPLATWQGILINAYSLGNCPLNGQLCFGAINVTHYGNAAVRFTVLYDLVRIPSMT